MRSLIGTAVLAGLLGTAAAAQDGGQDLGQAASDPTAALTAYVFQDFYTSSYHGLDDADGNRLQFRMAIPYTLGSTNNIFRLTLPYVTSNPGDSEGWSDATVFNLTTFDRSWGRFGLGAVALVPVGDEDLTYDRWGFGPAVGFIAQANWGIWGLFNQNLIDMGGDGDRDPVNVSVLQPIFSVNLNDGWSIGSSDMSITYDRDQDEFISIPVGLQLNKLVTFGTTPVQLGLSYEYNFQDDGHGPADVWGFTVKVLSP